MTDTTALVDRYIDMWNETDPARRRDLVAQVFAEGATYRDPTLQGDGRSGIEAMVQAVQEKFPRLRFRRTGEIDAHHDRARFGWELGAAGEKPLVTGVDFAVIGGGGRFEAVTGFFDAASGA